MKYVLRPFWKGFKSEKFWLSGIFTLTHIGIVDKTKSTLSLETPLAYEPRRKAAV